MNAEIGFEFSLLGYLLLNFDEVEIDELKEEYFEFPIHKKIFKKIKEKFDNGEKLDFLELEDKDISLEYLNKLVSSIPILFDFNTQKESLKKRFLKRKLRNLTEIVYSQMDSREPSELLNYSISYLESLDDHVEEVEIISFEESCNILIEDMNIAEQMIKENKLIGCRSGFVDLDKKLFGFQETELITIAGRPSMGKTTFAINTLVNIAKEGIPVLLYSFEMSYKEIRNKIIAREAQVDDMKIRSGYYTNQEKEKIQRARETIMKIPLYIVDRNIPVENPIFFKIHAKKMQRKFNIKVIAVDHIGLAIPAVDPVRELSRLTRVLKQTANDLNLIVIAISQLSRAVEKREDKRPILSDLRDSGSIEQDSNKVLFVYRDSYYQKKKGELEEESEDEVDIIIAKNRAGTLGTAKLIFDKKTSSFWDIEI